MRAFLEKTNGFLLDDFVFTSQFPLMDRGFELVPIETMYGLELPHVSLDNDIYVGSVEGTVKFFQECGVEVPSYLGYPETLKPFLDRKIEVAKVSDLEGMEYPYFIKPYKNVKQFTGDVITSDNIKEIFLNYTKVNQDTEIYISGIKDFLSEYRCFVHNGKLQGIHWYRGDFKLFPDVRVIETMIDEYKDAPVSYTLDVGLVWHGFPVGLQTTLVEVNDMWAIGSYGFDAKLYVRMLIDRFREINIKSKVK